MGEGLQDVPRQSNIEINVQEVKTQLKRIPNWKAPGPDQVQKNFTSLHGHRWCCLMGRSKEGSKTVLTSSNQSLSEVGIRRGIFQGNYLAFRHCYDPADSGTPKVKPGYVLRNDQIPINHLLFIDDLTLYGKNEREIESLVQTVRINSEDIAMEFGIQNCACAILKRGKTTFFDGI